MMKLGMSKGRSILWISGLVLLIATMTMLGKTEGFMFGRGYSYTRFCRFLIRRPHLLARLHGLMSYYYKHCYGSYNSFLGK